VKFIWDNKLSVLERQDFEIDPEILKDQLINEIEYLKILCRFPEEENLLLKESQ
jgi:hypothetical protein